MGWPWTEQTTRPADLPLMDTNWPRVSIVTPSYNQAAFLEETIRSVLLQGYPNLEYIIIDGGSTDGSVDIIRKYEPWLAYWVSEQDRGQSDALAKGFSRATGSILAWINSDDWYAPGVLHERVRHLQKHSDAALLCGDCIPVAATGNETGLWKSRRHLTPELLLLKGNQILQPTVFMRREALEAAGGIDTQLHYTMDYELWVRLGLAGRLMYVPGVVAYFRHHVGSKTVRESVRFNEEVLGWFDTGGLIEQVLIKDKAFEARRRLHVRAALDYLYSGDMDLSARYFAKALSPEGWPYGSVNRLATVIARTGSTVEESRTPDKHTDHLGRILSGLGSKGDLLLDRTLSRQRMDQLIIDMECIPSLSGRIRLLGKIVNEPLWLMNPEVLALLAEALSGVSVVESLLTVRETAISARFTTARLFSRRS
jgi:glycosyltransferase involved in cell wall biosynthesis